MIGDRLSEVLDAVEVRGVLTGGIAARGGWRGRGRVGDPVKFFAMVAGRARMSTDGLEEPLVLEAGDVAILAGRSWVDFEGGDPPRREVQPESDFSAAHFSAVDRQVDDVLIGGCMEVNQAGRALLLGALPPVTHVQACGPDADRLRSSLVRLFEEAAGERIGSAFAVRQYGQLLLLDVLRVYVGRADLPPGVLRLVADRRLDPAVGLMHAEPGRPWRLEELARAASMSRTSFAERFREVAGVPPLTYLNGWRMLLAQRALRDGEARVGELASELGYGSESAFSTAFKRAVGESPLRYRQRVRRLARPEATAS